MANPCGVEVREAMSRGELGFIGTPAQGNVRPEGAPWCADNGCYGKGWPGYDGWLKWLRRKADGVADCLFATAPDVVGDAQATLERSRPWLPVIRDIGYPAALVAQDGLELCHVPWDEFDVLFIGGTTEWKLGPEARALIGEAIHRGKRVHAGRVNSGKRYRYFKELGCHSADGTFLTFGPKVNYPKLRKWIEG